MTRTFESFPQRSANQQQQQLSSDGRSQISEHMRAVPISGRCGCISVFKKAINEVVPIRLLLP